MQKSCSKILASKLGASPKIIGRQTIVLSAVCELDNSDNISMV